MSGHLSSQLSSARLRVAVLLLICVFASGLAAAAPAGAAPTQAVTDENAPAEAAGGQVEDLVAQGPVAAAAAPPPIAPLGPVDPGPDQSVDVPRVGSPANEAIPPLPPVEPGPDESVSIARAPVVLDPPVEPSPLTLPLRPGQEVIDAIAASALATLGAAEPSFLDSGGSPDLDPSKLQPQVGSAQLLATNPATLQQTIDGLLNLQIPPPLPADPLALLQALPDGLPRLTYRLCSETATRAVSCSITLPLGVPQLVDVTGDGTVDILADLLPAVSPAAILGAVRELLDVQALLTATQNRLAAVLALLRDPLALLRNPGLLLEALQLPALILVLQSELQQKLDALVSLVNLGLGLLVQRLPTSETAGGPLAAHVWAVYDLPGQQRLSIGFDGARRGTTLPETTLGIFTFNLVGSILGFGRGVFDVRGELLQGGAGESLAVTMGLASVAQTPQGEAFDPTVASAQFAPVPGFFDAHAVVDLSAETAKIETTSDRSSRLDAIVVTRRAGDDVPFGRFTQLVVDQLPTSLSATLTRPPAGDTATLHYRASAPVAQVSFSDFEYAGARLDRSLTAAAQDLPADVDVSLESAQEPETVDVTVDYAANSRMTALDLGVYDRAADNIVATAALREIPSELELVVDLAEDHVSFISNERLGSAEAVVSRGLGSFAQLDGDHTTLVTDGAALGASARVSGLRSFDAYFGEHPRATAEFEPGGQPFVAAGDIDGVYKARLDISNLPASIDFDLDPAARTLSYDASSVVSEVKAAFINTVEGPTVFATVFDLPATVDASWELGEQSRLTYVASSAVPRVEFFASPNPIETLQPEADHYLSVAMTELPQEIDLSVDFEARHLEGELSAPLGAVRAVSRFPFAGDDYSAALTLVGVPARFDADFAEGTYRFRGLSGPLESAQLAVTNHPGTDAPTGQHLAVRYRETTGEFDASMAVRNLSHVEFSRGEATQTLRLDADTEGEPLFIDVDVVLAAGGVDDTRLAAVGRVDNLPSTLEVRLSDGQLIYEADRSVGLLAEFRLGKVAALDGLGAPLFDHGVAAVARGCAPGAGCAADDSVFCTVFASCFGAVGTVNLPGLPTSVVVDLDARTLEMVGYQPPPGVAFEGYIRLLGLIDSVPELEVLVTFDGLPSPLDLAVGPVVLGTDGRLDVGYEASGPIGSLRVDVEAETTTSFGVLRGRLTATSLPASLHVTGVIGDVTTINIDASAPIGSITATITGVDEGYLDASITDVPAQVDFVLDIPARHLESTASAPLGAVTVRARVPFGGRTWRAFAELTDVPARFDADFGDGTFRFRGLSGALGSAALAVTNHPGATAVAGNHLAVHYRESNGNLDASAEVNNLTHAEYSRGPASHTVRLDIADAPVFVDADIILAGDIRLALAARLSGFPNTARFGLVDGVPTYSSDNPISILAEVKFGRVATLSSLGAPIFDNGIAVRARGCGGSGCDGVVGTINLPSLPTTVSLDLEARTVSIDGYQGPSTLQVYLGLEDSAPFSGALLVTLTGIPSALTFTLDNTAVDKGRFDLGYTASSGIGSLDVRVEATDTAAGMARGRAFLSPVPAEAAALGQFGSVTNLDYTASTAIDEFTLQATATVDGFLASGLFRLTDIPTMIELRAGGFGDDNSGFNVPTLTYEASASTLDGLVQVEAALAREVGPVIAGIKDLYVVIDNLGADTTITYTGVNRSISVNSNPATDRLQIGGGVYVGAIPTIVFDEVLKEFLGGFFKLRLEGNIDVAGARIDDLDIALTGVQSLTVRPGRLPAEVDPVVGFLFPGFDGQFGGIELQLGDVDIDITGKLIVRVDRTVGPDAFYEEFNFSPTSFVRIHRYDNGRGPIRRNIQVELGPLDIVCFTVNTTPRFREEDDNHIFIPGTGEEGPQMLFLGDPGGQANGYLIDLAMPDLSPFPGAGRDVSDLDPGSCG